MANPNGSKGYRWEKTVVDLFNDTEKNAELFQAQRNHPEDNDLSDVRVGRFGEWLIECKDWAEIKLPTFLNQLGNSIIRAGVMPFKGAVFVKNRRHAAGQGYAVMRIRDFKQLMLYVMTLEGFVRERTGEDLASLGWDYSVNTATQEDEGNGN